MAPTYDILGNGDKRALYDEGGLELVKERKKQSAGQGGGRLPKGPSKNSEVQVRAMGLGRAGKLGTVVWSRHVEQLRGGVVAVDTDPSGNDCVEMRVAGWAV